MDELENEEKFNKEKSMKIIKILIIILVLLFLLIIGIGFAVYYMKSKEFKVIIDGVQNSKIAEDAFVIDGNQIYVSIKDIAPFLGNYQYNNGEYKQYSEDKTSCYLQNDYEAVTYSLNSSTIYKTVLSEETVNTTSKSKTSTDTDTNYEYFTLDAPVKMINNKLYTTTDGISKGCNIYITYNSQANRVEIYTLSKLVSLYTNKISDSAIADEKALFSNKKAILYDLVVVKDEKGEYGVKNTTGTEIIGKKYSYIKFLESAQEFIVKTDEGKMGIISKDGTTKIKPDYDEIKQIDKDKGLYLVSNNSKYGVINKNGKLVIYLEFEKIGIDPTQFTSDNIKNNYLLYDNCIPVEKGEKWGLMDKNGNTIIEPQYDSLGCVVGTSASKTANNILLIPEYEGIIVCKDKLYGIINSSGKELIPPATTNIYSITSSGENSYYLTYNKQTLNVIDYLKNTLGLQPVTENKGTTNNQNTNKETNTVTENTTTTNQLIENVVNNQVNQ